MNEMQELQKMSPEELQELIEIYRAKKGGTMRAGQLHKPVLVNPYEEQLLGSLPNVSGQVDPMTGLRSYAEGDPSEFDPGYGAEYSDNPELDKIHDETVKEAERQQESESKKAGTTITYSVADLDGTKH